MGHDHQNNNAAKNISVAFFLNAFFVLIELVGGIITNSIAILSDALHDFGDCFSLGVAWWLQKKSAQKRDAHYSYGYKRFSLLGSVFLSGVLTVSSVFVIYEAIKRIASPQDVSAQGMLYMAIFGVVINGLAALRLKKGTSLNERAVFLHIMEDVLGWLGVLVVSIIMLFVYLPVLDPILSIVISVWVVSNVYTNLRDTFKIFLQATPDGVNVSELLAKIEAIDGIDSVHDLHLWTLDGESHVMTLHAVTSYDNNSELKDAISTIAKTYSINHVTVEVESPNAVCKRNCDCE